MKKLYVSLALVGLVSAPGVVMAEDSPFSGNISLTSNYLFRGVSQTQNGPALQGGFDYAHSSGFYVGTWASNVAWVKEGGFKDDSSMEIDLYAGYSGSVTDDLGYDVGVITYYYPGDKVPGVRTPDTTEAYVSASWKFLTLKYSNVISKDFIGWVGPLGEKTRGSDYIELNAEYDLGNGWGVSGHVGYQKVKNLGAADYTDWSLGVSKDIGFGTLAVSYWDTDADTGLYTIAGEKLADGKFVVSFSKDF